MYVSTITYSCLCCGATNGWWAGAPCGDRLASGPAWPRLGPARTGHLFKAQEIAAGVGLVT